MRILIDHVTKVLGGNRVLDDVCLELHSGNVYGFQGINASGKTMLLRAVAGLIKPTTGRVCIDGVTLGQKYDFPESMGVLIENPAFLPEYTGFQNLKLLAELKHRISDKEIRQSIWDVGLRPGDKRKYRKYSLGMKQRLGVAAALMERPELILLDEPTNALDEDGVELVQRLILREKERGALILLACHDASVLEGVSDEIYKVAEGKVRVRKNEE